MTRRHVSESPQSVCMERCHICMHPFEWHHRFGHAPETVEQTVERVLRQRLGVSPQEATFGSRLRRLNATTVRFAEDREPGRTRIV